MLPAHLQMASDVELVVRSSSAGSSARQQLATGWFSLQAVASEDSKALGPALTGALTLAEFPFSAKARGTNSSSEAMQASKELQ